MHNYTTGAWDAWRLCSLQIQYPWASEIHITEKTCFLNTIRNYCGNIEWNGTSTGKGKNSHLSLTGAYVRIK